MADEFDELDDLDEAGCGHAACACAAGGYCSPYCEDQDEDEEGGESECQCGHPDCAAP